jgi:predicted RNA methylase
MKKQRIQKTSLFSDLDKEIDDLILRFCPRENRSKIILNLITSRADATELTDYHLDSVFPEQISRKSHPHWTPVKVASRATELLSITKLSKVLDVGSGCGKFCIVASLKSEGFFLGIEQRGNLVKAARKVAKELHLENVSFIKGNMMDIDWTQFNSIYLFNPFFENVMKDSSFWIDTTIDLNKHLYNLYIRTVEEKLSKQEVGTRVVTYHGFGGMFPKSYDLILKEPIYSGHLELWVKLRP